MPALAADIARALRGATIVEVETPAIKVAFSRARDGRSEPVKGYFDIAADAQTALTARMGLIGTIRRRWAVGVDGMIWPDLTLGVPVWRLVDAEHDVDGKCLTARLQIDAEEETTSLELFG